MSHMHWNPVTGESQVFAEGEVKPEGWLDYHPEDSAKAPPPEALEPVEPAPAPDAPLKRKELVEALTEGGLNFNTTSTNKDLNTLLTSALLQVLEEGKVEVPPGASTRELLVLVRNQ